MDRALNFEIFRPKGRLSSHIQALWSVSVSSKRPVKIQKWLHSDACSGILFNLGNAFSLGDKEFSANVILLPVSKEAQLLTLSTGARLIGVRFHPAISFGFFKATYNQPMEVKAGATSQVEYDALYQELSNQRGHYANITFLYKWIDQAINDTDKMPSSLKKSLNALRYDIKLSDLGDYGVLSQRQIERQFQRWLSMSPKHYQRILRVKNALTVLKTAPNTELAGFALNNGFTDQAHMTREFKQIAKTTPGKYCKMVICNNC